jgi:hypothetical protein
MARTTFKYGGEECWYEPAPRMRDYIVITTPWGTSGPIKIDNIPVLTAARIEAGTLKGKAKIGLK